jgi:hypothetical protein
MAVLLAAFGRRKVSRHCGPSAILSPTLRSVPVVGFPVTDTASAL